MQVSLKGPRHAWMGAPPGALGSQLRGEGTIEPPNVGRSHFKVGSKYQVEGMPGRDSAEAAGAI